MLYVSKRTKNVFSDRFKVEINTTPKGDRLKKEESNKNEEVKSLEEVPVLEEVVKKKRSRKNNEENIEEDGRE